MDKALSRYLDRGIETAWPLEGDTDIAVRQVVVIPCLGEAALLSDCLPNLLPASQEALDHTLVLVVVNNRADARDEDRALNQDTLTQLRQSSGIPPGLRVAWVDAASPGRELPQKEGVGLARKIGMDWGLRLLAAQGCFDGPLVCLDGDTTCGPGYLDGIAAFFAREGRWGAVMDYTHPLPEEPQARAAILHYELHLRCHEAGLAQATSPYAYTALGSAMTSTARAYATVSGMPRRQAGEDFYFLEKLAKTGRIDAIPGVTVYPSGRASHRVPFGTGRSVQEFLDGRASRSMTYHPEVYEVLRRFLEAVQEALTSGDTDLFNALGDVPEAQAFLKLQGFEKVWPKMAQQCRDSGQMLRQFHRYFDAFRSLKFIHHLRDNGYPDVLLVEALPQRFPEVAAGASDLEGWLGVIR